MEIYNDYLLVMPSGNCKGFNDLEGVKAHINVYYERRLDDTLHEDGYNDGERQIEIAHLCLSDTFTDNECDEKGSNGPCQFITDSHARNTSGGRVERT